MGAGRAVERGGGESCGARRCDSVGDRDILDDDSARKIIAAYGELVDAPDALRAPYQRYRFKFAAALTANR